MTAAVSNLHKHLENVTEAIANTNNHLTQRVQNLDDQLLEQKEISKSILENVGDTKGSIEELYVTVTELQSALTGLVSSASTCIGVGKIWYIWEFLQFYITCALAVFYFPLMY
ncbi:hypothetical protein ACE6H2_020748 [Prunus campanulata]